MKRYYLDPITTHQDLSSGDLSFTTSIGKDFRLLSVEVHASVAISETIKVVRDSGAGANYDTELASKAMSSEQDYVFRPSDNCVFLRGDEVKVTCTNSGGTGIVYVAIYVEEI